MSAVRRPAFRGVTSWSRLVLAALLFIQQAILAGCLPAPATRLPAETAGASESWYRLYFTNPDASTAKSLRGGPDAALAAAIQGARLSVDMAVLDLDLWSIRDALLEAHRRGVAVRVVVESDYLDEPEIQDLIEAGVPVLGDRREGLMHNKFVVVDRLEVWTGSMNATLNDAYRNNNNLLSIRSAPLAGAYTVEFEEMFVEDRFGPGSPANTPDSSISVDGALLEIYFSPDDGAASHLVELIESARESIRFMAFSFTSDAIAGALIRKKQAGVDVSGVFDESQVGSNQGTEYEKLRSAGLQVRLDGSPRSMHHKVIIIDSQVVVTGSYNFSRNAEETNDENTLVIHHPQIAAQYLEEFHRVFSQAKV